MSRFLHITGRRKELIITAGGENVAPVRWRLMWWRPWPLGYNATFGDPRALHVLPMMLCQVPIENMIKEELSCISQAMLIGDRRKFVSCLLTFKVQCALTCGVAGVGSCGALCHAITTSLARAAEVCRLKLTKRALQRHNSRRRRSAVR